jgi:hypothetical protein
MFEINFLTLLLSSLDINTLGSLTSLSRVCVVILFLREIRKKNKKKRNFLFFGEFYLFVICARI